MKFKIRNIATHYPNNVVDNNYYINHFKELGQDMGDFYEKIGQNKRKIVENEEETTFTLGLKAAEKVLHESGLTGKDIDLIIFTSQFPEYTIPSQSLLIHDYIKGKREALTFDINANCVGMVVGFNTAINYMKGMEECKRTLLIGADYASKHMRTDNMLYSYFGDMGCATIIERIEDESQFLIANYSTVSHESGTMFFPGCGLSKIYREIPKNEKKTSLSPWTVDLGTEAILNMDDLLSKSNLTIDDIKVVCMSQAAKPNVIKVREHYNVDEYKVPFNGDEYGYCGTSSPFVVLKEQLDKGYIKENDKVLLWSIGASFTSCGVLFEF